jgi:(R,R)-butanediol dehydrogenase / meso-butanediol dehydrogenase / diacetyl reductase
VLDGGRALVLDRPREWHVRAVPAATPGAGEVVVEPAYVGLCGTDLHIAAGRHPRARLPLVLGHEIVGVPRAGRWAGQAVVVDPTISCGRCAACRSGDGHVCLNLRLVGIDRPGGLAGRLCVAEAKLHPVPAGLPLTTAALAEPLAVAVHASARAGSYLGARVVVLGAGPIGLLTGLVTRAAGARVVLLVEPRLSRREAAKALGFEAAAEAGAVPDLLGGHLADVVFDAAGVPAAARHATRLVRPRGVIVVEGLHGEPAAVDLATLTFAELTMTGTRVYRPTDLDQALGLLAAGSFDVTPLISEVVDLDDVPAALGRLERGESVKILARINYQPKEKDHDPGGADRRKRQTRPRLPDRAA